MSRPGAAERLSRLLAIVPWIVAQDGPTVADICERFGVSERDLIADLNLLFMCGVYPYTPDTLIEVDIDGGRVWVRFADWFKRPLRLTPPEGLALMAAARAILGVPQPGRETNETNEERSRPRWQSWRWSSALVVKKRSTWSLASLLPKCCRRFSCPVASSARCWSITTPSGAT